MTVYLSKAEILTIHRQVLQSEGSSFAGDGILNAERFESAVVAPEQSGFGVEFYPSLVEKAAVLFRGLLCDHPFQDGNKRTAFGALNVFLRRNGYASVFSDYGHHDGWVVAYAKRCAELTVEEIAEDLTLRIAAAM